MMQLRRLFNQGWNVFLLCGFCLLWGWGLAESAIAQTLTQTSSPLQQPPIEIQISLGNNANELKFFPSDLDLKAGQRYKLILNNPSPQKHYFTAKDFADASWTQKIEAGNVEIKGAIHEVELKPQASAEWVIVPLKPGTYTLRCPIAGHTEAGMMGKIRVSS